MNPLAQLMMAANGHGHLPPQVQMPGGAGAPMGGAPAPMPPSAGGGGGAPGGSDKQVAQTAEEQLVHFASAASDPELKTVFSTALAALHKYLAQDQKETHQAMQGKVSPKQMAGAYGLR